MDESKEEKSEAEDAPDPSPAVEIDKNGGESLFTEPDGDWYEEKPFEDVQNGKKRKFILMAVLLGVIASAGFFWWFAKDGSLDQSKGTSLNQQAEKAGNFVKSRFIDVSSGPQMPQEHEEPSQAAAPEDAPFSPADKLEKAERLRSELLRKQEEIQALKEYYGDRINEVRDEILNEKDQNGITTFQQALANKQIELRLRTIKRRDLYIHQLDQPLEQLRLGSEELLYLERFVGIQIQMAPVVKGIDMAELGKRVDAVIEKARDGAGSLAIGTAETGAPSLEEIWNGLIHEANMKRPSESKDRKGEKLDEERAYSQQQDKINSEIWQEICVGDLSRKQELTKLSLNAAKCLSQWEEGKDLFLNGITEISASIAGQLSQWKGDWLCLNGLTELVPEAAERLSRWQGNRLSLNGLMELTPQAAKHLSEWKGKQIEIVGLAAISSVADKYLTAWQETGGKIYMRTLP